MHTGKHILFWVIVTIVMIFGFGSTFNDYNKTFYFVTFLMPVAMATSYLFNYYLVPTYLLQRRLFRFTLYTFYAVIGSLFLQMVVITLSFIIIANYNFGEMEPVMANIFLLALTIYLIVFLKAFVLLYRRNINHEFRLEKLIQDKEALKTKFITVKENRVNRQIQLDEILYFESLSDYVQIYFKNGSVTTKETITFFDESLPEYFIRIHRSFIVNRQHVDSFTSKKVDIYGTELPISRTYKKSVLDVLS